MDRIKIESALDFLNEYRRQKSSGFEIEWAIEYAIEDLRSALRNPDADPCDECECEGCKTTEPAQAGVDDEYAELERLVRDGIKAMDERSDFGCLKFDPIIDGPSDYEIRLKAWESVQGFWFPDESEFDEAFAAATKLYNFLSGQNEDMK
jgi:hypothetical protein